MSCLLLLAALLQADALLPENTRPGPHDWLVKNETIVQLHQHTNSWRAQNGRHPLILDTQMCLDAQRHANWMATYGFGHSGMAYMEIINQSHVTAAGAVNGWAVSGPHNGIMLSGTTRVGFGYARSTNGYPYWVGVFR